MITRQYFKGWNVWVCNCKDLASVPTLLSCFRWWSPPSITLPAASHLLSACRGSTSASGYTWSFEWLALLSLEEDALATQSSHPPQNSPALLPTAPHDSAWHAALPVLAAWPNAIYFQDSMQEKPTPQVTAQSPSTLSQAGWHGPVPCHIASSIRAHRRQHGNCGLSCWSPPHTISHSGSSSIPDLGP